MPQKTRVLLAHSYFLRYDPKQVRKMKPYPPLATLLTAAVLKRRGVPVALFDAMLAADESGFLAMLERERPDVVGILEDNFNFLTKMCLTQNRELAFTMTRQARQASIPVQTRQPCPSAAIDSVAGGNSSQPG